MSKDNKMNFLKDFAKNGKAVNKYVVFNLQNYAPRVIHDTQEEAVQEAMRISESPSYNHQPLFVMKITDVLVPKTVRFGTRDSVYPKIDTDEEDEEEDEEHGIVIDKPIISEQFFKHTEKVEYDLQEAKRKQVTDYVNRFKLESPYKEFLDAVLTNVFKKGFCNIKIKPSESGTETITDIKDLKLCDVSSGSPFDVVLKSLFMFPSVVECFLKMTEKQNFDFSKASLKPCKVVINKDDILHDLYNLDAIRKAIENSKECSFYIVNTDNERKIYVQSGAFLRYIIKFRAMSAEYIVALLFQAIDNEGFNTKEARQPENYRKTIRSIEKNQLTAVYGFSWS